MLKALLFDLDGTLANTDPVHRATWQEVLREYGIAVDEALYRERFSGRLNEHIVKDLLPHLSAEQGKRLAAYKEAEFRKRAGNLTPLPGLLPMLDWMDAVGMKRSLVTNAPKDNAATMLQILGLTKRFPVIVLGDELPMGKPDPLPYQLGLSRLGVLPNEAIAFEDSPSGIRAAVRAGVATIGVTTTHSADELYDLGVTLAVTDFTDPTLWALLRSPSATQVLAASRRRLTLA
ncbi:MAG TPA: HAD family phosphatase [Chroococcidiopsis sp.]